MAFSQKKRRLEPREFPCKEWFELYHDRLLRMNLSAFPGEGSCCCLLVSQEAFLLSEEVLLRVESFTQLLLVSNFTCPPLLLTLI